MEFYSESTAFRVHKTHKISLLHFDHGTGHQVMHGDTGTPTDGPIRAHARDLALKQLY